MQKRTINGIDYLEYDGSIQNIRNSDIDTEAQLFSNLQFEDGKLVENVLADNATATFVDNGVAGQFAFAPLGKALVVVGVTINGAFRAADHRFWASRKNRDLTLAMSNFLLAGGIAYFAQGLGLFTLLPLAFGVSRLFAHHHTGKLVKLIKQLEQHSRRPVVTFAGEPPALAIS